MKIAINTRLLLENKLEGIGWFTYESLKRITQHHPEHEFIFIFDRPYSKQFIFSDNVTPVVVFPPARHPFLWYWWFEISLPRIFKKYKPDIFLSTDGYLSLQTKIPQITVIHDINYEYYPSQFNWLVKKYLLHFMPLFARKATRIVTVSEYSKKDISDKYTIKPEKIDVVYNGSNLVYKPLTNEEKLVARDEFAGGCEYFIYIGALLPRKNVARLLKAFDQFKVDTKSNVKLVIVGEKMFNTHDIEQAYKDMQHKDDVNFTGRLSAERISKALGGALALTYVSYFEGFGIPLVEAMYCDVPVITSNKTSLPEVAGDAAIYCDPFTVESITKAMVDIYSSGTLRNQLIENGRIQRQKFSWDKTADRLWDSLKKVLKE